MNKTPRHIAIENAAADALTQMQQVHRMFADDREFNLALNGLQTALDPKPRPLKFHVLVIENDSGISSSIHSSKRGATKALYAYVCENWGEVGTEKAPRNMQEAIDEYFGRDVCDDRAEIEACEVED